MPPRYIKLFYIGFLIFQTFDKDFSVFSSCEGIGDLVFYATTANGITTRTLYRCTTDHNSAAWNAAHFTATTLEVELQRVRDSESDTDMIGDLFGTKTTYVIGDYCIYNDNLYRCIQAVDNTGVATPAFDPDDWMQVALANDVSDLNSALSTDGDYTIEWTNGKRITSNGIVNSGAQFYISQFIPVTNSPVLSCIIPFAIVLNGTQSSVYLLFSTFVIPAVDIFNTPTFPIILFSTTNVVKHTLQKPHYIVIIRNWHNKYTSYYCRHY